MILEINSRGPGMKIKKFSAILFLFIVIFAMQIAYFDYKITRQTDELFDLQYEIGRQIETLRYRIENIESQVHFAAKRSFVNIHKVPTPVTFCGDTLDYSDPILRERIDREFYSLLGNQGQIQLYLKRMKKYFPHIENHLRKSRLPVDLKYLAVHESALLPSIRSRSSAVGLWQFMRSTGRLYNLKINHYVDERRDPYKATPAAMRLIKNLYNKFQKWPLVLAAYNGGDNRLSKMIKKQASNSFVDLSLPEETERYYFKILATKLVLAQYERFGFQMNEDDYFHSENLYSFEFTVTENQISLTDIANKCDMTLAAFKIYNPQFINSYLPRGIYLIHIPESNRNTFQANIALQEKRKFDYTDAKQEFILMD